MLAKYRFIEITGASGVGKSWLLSHLFKKMEGVKFTNLPTPQSTYTLNPQILQTHMAGRWGAPNKWFYLLDDLATFQTWGKAKLGVNGYSALQDYVTQAGKLGGVFVWTNNGTVAESCFELNKNKSWKVLNYITFLNKYSLIMVKTNDNWYDLLPTIVAIDNEEIEGFYDKFWNIPKSIQENFLTYVAEETRSLELGAIINAIQEGNSNLSQTSDHNLYRQMLEYIQLRKVEEQAVREKSQKISKLQKELKKYKVSNKKITPQDIAKWDKQEKDKKSKSERGKKPAEELLEEQSPSEDLDQIHQDPDLTEQLINEQVNEPNKSNKKKRRK